jgi:hypothetical protein
MAEVWKEVPGYQGYEVSTFGGFRNYWSTGGGRRRLLLTPRYPKGQTRNNATYVRMIDNSGKEFRRSLHWIILETFIGPCPPGMTAVRGPDLDKFNNRMDNIYWVPAPKLDSAFVHHLILEAFVGPRPRKMMGCHNDGNSLNNHIDNLRWDTATANTIDAINHGSHHSLKLHESDITDIWKLLVDGQTVTEVARRYGVTFYAIYTIKTGKTWSRITKNLPGWPLVSLEPDNRLPIYIPDEIAKSTREIWKVIPGRSAHRVSNFGRVQSCLEIVKGQPESQHWQAGDEWKFLNPVTDKNGYKRVKVGPKLEFVHRLVLLAFAGPCPVGMVGCHEDGNQSNNNSNNLRWDTQQGNARDREKHARAQRKLALPIPVHIPPN